ARRGRTAGSSGRGGERGAPGADEAPAVLLLETGSVGRILSEVAAQAAGDRVRKARLLPGAAQAALLGRIGDIGGLDEHRGNIAGLEHHEAGALHLRLAHLAHPLERAHHPLRCAGTDADDLVLRRIDQHRLESALVVAARARDEIRGVQRDRKSTRLNSSHRTISYAVFCLKKKKKKKKRSKNTM